MAAPRARDPKMDWGFHAVIPRIIRTEYKELTPIQRWFYVCLKDLCGEHGTCYRTVRALVEETGISAGMISESIPVLHKHGLIHAEKKRRHTGGKEVWHITIVDIWQLNGKLHPTKRSPAEQECSQYEQTPGQQNVHTVNVHPTNNKPEVRSPAEQECSLCETEEESTSSIITEAGSEEGTLPAHDHDADSGATAPTAPSSHDSTSHENTEDEPHGHNDNIPTHSPGVLHRDALRASSQPEHTVAAHERILRSGDATTNRLPERAPEHAHGMDGRDQPAHTTSERVAPAESRGYENTAELSTSRASSPQQSAKVEPRKQGRRGKKTEEPEPEPIVLSPEAEKIWRAWCSLFTVEVELIPSNAKAAEKLVKPARVWCGKLHWTLAQWLKAIKDNAYAADNKGYYSKRGVKLFDIPRELEGWQSAKEHELSTLAQAANPKPAEPKPIDPTLQALRQQRLQYAQGAMQ